VPMSFASSTNGDEGMVEVLSDLEGDEMVRLQIVEALRTALG